MTDTPQSPLEPQQAADLATKARELADKLADYAVSATQSAGDAMTSASSGGHSDFFMMGLTVFVLACFVGYYVVWKVTPALHSPLMSMANAISSVVIIGAILAAGPADGGMAQTLGFFAIILASINIFGGFVITRRMLSMFKKKDS